MVVMKGKSKKDTKSKQAKNGQNADSAGKRKRDSKTEEKPPEVEVAKVIPEETEDVESVKNRLVRLQADFDNFRKRTVRDRDATYARANEDIMEELLPVLDHMELALDAATAENVEGGFVDGVRLVADQFVSVLGKFGLKPLDAADAEFDPNIHEAVSHLPSPDVSANGIVAQVRRGYMLREKLLRPAQVVVSIGSTEEQASGS